MEHLTEEDVKQRFITPALVETAGWDREQLFMEAFAPGQIIVDGRKTRRGRNLRADYVLRMKGTGKAIAVVEAKGGNRSVSAGLQQAMGYAVKLDAPFAYSSNGTGFIEHDFLTGAEREFGLGEFPSEDELWQRYVDARGLSGESQQVLREPYHYDQFIDKEPRYYQRIAIDRTVEAVAQDRRRLLLVMATGTGKTFTAFQIIWRLLEAGKVKRVLYLADRNYLLDQTISGDFRPLGNRLTKVRNRRLDSSYEVYLSLYHQLAGEDGMEPFRQFKPEFFDLVVVDECHRGSAKDDSQWRAVLDYFSSAIHLGLTATPKETKEVSNITYFGDPIYTYSLKEGIADGFLAPYKVLRAGLNVDLEGWRPEEGKTDVEGHLVEDREYNIKDFDRNLIIDERTQMVAKYVSSWLRKYGQDSKTIVFCSDIEHAERMRQALANENVEQMLADHRYVMRITGDDEEGKNQLENFADVNEPYPTVVTTSKLLTTGVDVKTIKLIVLEANIGSMTEFKQIIGRGTRLAPEYGKEFFTILDFRGSTRLFADPDFDGEPVVIKDVLDGDRDGEPDWPEDDDIDPPIEPGPCPGVDLDDDIEPLTPIDDDRDRDRDPIVDPGKPRKVRVRGVEVRLLNERVQFIDPKSGKLVTESVTDYSRKNLLGQYATLSEFLEAWSHASRKAALIEELQEQGVLLAALRDEAGDIGQDLDDFDLIMHVAFDKPPLTRKERANKVKKTGYLHKYSEECQAVLSGLLEKYATLGVTQIEDIRILANDPFSHFGSPPKIVKMFGGKDDYLKAVHELVDSIYAA
ncbi:EcoAI/FtnUII family type I restriction enzme subunit R [Boudabousia liubingyangii]|uniref:EcoAI/FtnUII family type I restriction enzme subunit R n=1 Tax=Boudabousia liubingyangii TaxID=1921764 RepID=UPI000A421977|nr:DEAD/DEAH box helicase family protein [Boudabousia liubingyangii]